MRLWFESRDAFLEPFPLGLDAGSCMALAVLVAASGREWQRVGHQTAGDAFNGAQGKHTLANRWTAPSSLGWTCRGEGPGPKNSLKKSQSMLPARQKRYRSSASLVVSICFGCTLKQALWSPLKPSSDSNGLTLHRLHAPFKSWPKKSPSLQRCSGCRVAGTTEEEID